MAEVFVVCTSETARFEGTDWVCEESGDGVGFGCGFETWIGISRAGGSAGESGLCEKRQVVRLQFWMSGHLVFLNSPRLVNIVVCLQTRPATVPNRERYK